MSGLDLFFSDPFFIIINAFLPAPAITAFCQQLFSGAKPTAPQFTCFSNQLIDTFITALILLPPGKCVFGGPVANVLPLVEKADGIVFGAPVHYGTAAASMLGFMHRLAISGGKYLRHKPAAVVTSARRAGTTTALEAMEKVPQFFEMPLISSTYWPMVHGGKAEEVLSDEEGLQIMRNLGRNMAWMLRCIEAGKAAGIAAPVAENDKRTNFIR